MTRRHSAVAALVGLVITVAAPAVSRAQDELIVANALAPSIGAYTRTANGDVPPLRLLVGPAAALGAPVSVAVDPIHDEIIVLNVANQSVAAYPRAAAGDVAPIRTLAGPGTGLVNPVSVLVDPFHDELVVANAFGQSITV